MSFLRGIFPELTAKSIPIHGKEQSFSEARKRFETLLQEGARGVEVVENNLLTLIKQQEGQGGGAYSRAIKKTPRESEGCFLRCS